MHTNHIDYVFDIKANQFGQKWASKQKQMATKYSVVQLLTNVAMITDRNHDSTYLHYAVFLYDKKMKKKSRKLNFISMYTMYFCNPKKIF